MTTKITPIELSEDARQLIAACVALDPDVDDVVADPGVWAEVREAFADLPPVFEDYVSGADCPVYRVTLKG